MKNLLCVSVLCLSLLSGCALHRKLFYSDAEMNEYNVKEQAKTNEERSKEIAINRVFSISDNNDKEKFDCQLIAFETASSMMGFTTSGDVQRALHEAKEISVEKGGNALKLLMSSTRFDSTSITFEIYKCKKSPFDN